MMRLLLLLMALLSAPVCADEFKPAYLQLTERGSGAYDVLWKVPALDESTSLKVSPLFPPGTRETSKRRRAFANGDVVVRWRIAVPRGLDGRTITFPNQMTTRIDVLVRVVRADGTEQIGRALPTNPGFTITASPGQYEVMRAYTVLGIEHILTGVDHLLFVLALVLLVKGTRQLLWTVTAFTIAHSVTLALATLGVIHVPGPPVEAMIALSIVFVAHEIVQQTHGRDSLTSRKPWLVAFSFGLLHGLGFAGALADVGLPENSVPLALLFFNIGVEIGQLLFIAGVLATTQMTRALAKERVSKSTVSLVMAYAIGGIASYWVIDRISAFWS